MDKERIILTEESNDGQNLYLYYDHMVGAYIAYGLSAYYATIITDPYLLCSEEMGMPVALLKLEKIKFFRSKLQIMEHVTRSFYHFRLHNFVGRVGYEKWLKRNFPEYVEND